MGPINLENKLNIGPIPSPLHVFLANDKEFNGVGAGGVSPPTPRQFLKFQVLNGAILALFFHFFTFSTEKVGKK